MPEGRQIADWLAEHVDELEVLGRVDGVPAGVAVVTDEAVELVATALQPDDDADVLGSGDATDGQVLTADGAGGAAWETPSGGGGGAVDSVNGDTGTVVLDADDIDDTSTAHKFATAAQLSAADTAVQPGDLGTAAAADTGDFATAAQGGLADTAVQPGDLGTAAAADTGDFATAAQGSSADTAVQPGDDADTLGSGAATDGQVLTADGSGNTAWETPAEGGGAQSTVFFGSTAGTARPTNPNPVIWVGHTGTTPTNAESYDIVHTFDPGGSAEIWEHADTIAFYEASAANFTPDSGAGATWTDLSSNGNDATRTTGNAHPSLVLAGSSPMGIDSLLRDADLEFFDPISGAGPDATSYIVAWLAWDASGTRTGHIAGSTTAGDGNNLWQFGRDNSEPGTAYHGGTAYELGTGTHTVEANQVVVMRYDKTAGHLYLRVDGVAVDDVAVAADYLGEDLQLLTFNGVTTNAFYGHIANFGVWSTDDTDLVDDIEAYLMDRGGIT